MPQRLHSTLGLPAYCPTLPGEYLGDLTALISTTGRVCTDTRAECAGREVGWGGGMRTTRSTDYVDPTCPPRHLPRAVSLGGCCRRPSVHVIRSSLGWHTVALSLMCSHRHACMVDAGVSLHSRTLSVFCCAPEHCPGATNPQEFFLRSAYFETDKRFLRALHGSGFRACTEERRSTGCRRTKPSRA